MRASDLLHRRVEDVDGRYLGMIVDLRCRIEGFGSSAGPTAKVTHLLISKRSAASMLGYDRQRQHGPAVIRRLVAALHRDARIVGAEDVVSWGPPVRLSSPGRDLDRPDPRAEPARDEAGRDESGRGADA